MIHKRDAEMTKRQVTVLTVDGHTHLLHLLLTGGRQSLGFRRFFFAHVLKGVGCLVVCLVARFGNRVTEKATRKTNNLMK